MLAELLEQTDSKEWNPTTEAEYVEATKFEKENN